MLLPFPIPDWGTTGGGGFCFFSLLFSIHSQQTGRKVGTGSAKVGTGPAKGAAKVDRRAAKGAEKVGT